MLLGAMYGVKAELKKMSSQWVISENPLHKRRLTVLLFSHRHHHQHIRSHNSLYYPTFQSIVTLQTINFSKMKFFQILPVLSLAGLAMATPAPATVPQTKNFVPEPANPPKQPANIPLYSSSSLSLMDSTSTCERWHHTFKNGHSLGWCAGCKRLERCGFLLTAEAAACLAAITVWGPGEFKNCCSIHYMF